MANNADEYGRTRTPLRKNVWAKKGFKVMAQESWVGALHTLSVHEQLPICGEEVSCVCMHVQMCLCMIGARDTRLAWPCSGQPTLKVLHECLLRCMLLRKSAYLSSLAWTVLPRSTRLCHLVLACPAAVLQKCA